MAEGHLLEGWLACPVCRGALAFTSDLVQCRACGRRYPVRDGIPVLQSDAATSG